MVPKEQDPMQAKQLAGGKKKVDLSDTESQIKPCIKCGSIRRYPPRPGTKTGACIDCANARNKRWEDKNKERVKEVQLLYKMRNLETWKKTKRNSAAKERKSNPEKIKARNQVHDAIRKGILLPVSQCSCKDCGVTACDYHHENYLLPLEVIPLCRGCHILRHKKKK
jgi:hypothetical protein